MTFNLKKIYKDKIFKNYNIVVTGSEGKLGKKIVDLYSLFDANLILIDKVDATKDREDWYNHISWWNYNRLEKILKETGFSTINKSAYAQSKFLILKDVRYFDQTAPWYSVYVDANK